MCCVWDWPQGRTRSHSHIHCKQLPFTHAATSNSFFKNNGISCFCPLLSCWWDFLQQDTSEPAEIQCYFQMFHPLAIFYMCKEFKDNALWSFTSSNISNASALWGMWTSSERRIALLFQYYKQSLAVAPLQSEVQPFSLFVMELCVGWELSDVGSQKASTWKRFCSVIS